MASDGKDEKPPSSGCHLEDWVGNVNAIELQAEGGGSAIEETAILFANGLIEPAEAGLRAAIQSDQLGESAQRGWLMLFELLQQRGDKAGFDSLTIEYVLRFESSPPAWIDYKDDVDLGCVRADGAARSRPSSSAARERRRGCHQASRAAEKSFAVASVDHTRLVECAQRRPGWC